MTRRPSLTKTRILATALVAITATQAISETLTDALVSAYNNSHLLEQNRAVLRAADEDVAQAVAVLRPTLDYGVSRQFQQDFDNDNTVAYNTLELTSDLTIYEFGRNRVAIEAAKESVLSARESLIAQEQSVFLDAVAAYMSVRRALEFVNLGQSNVRVLQEEVRAAQDRFEVGEVTRTDVAQAQSRLALAEANLSSAEGDLEVARENYRLAVGRYPGDLAPPPALPRVPATEAEARTVALRTHPRILEAQHLVTVAELNMSRAEAAVMPSLSASASVGYSDQQSSDGNLEPSARAGISFGGPIYRGGALNSVFRQARAQRDQNRANLLQTSSSIAERLGVAWANAEVARATLEATGRQIEAAQIAFDGTREEATLGSRTTLDVLNAEQELLNARADRIDATAQEYIAYYSLLAAMGQLTVDYLNLPVTAYDPSAYYNSVRNAPAIGSEQGIRLDRVLQSIGKY
ncbi:TolC family outer membrane protein [Qingshengfaniella alkalisoli]|uniref:TolC family outer membrane protein n=1 Tax=Qingshengfaniella alkalisoli TaxID=2599296 RepID=A0A5B8I9I1_9RHOB|nr:TolC family outer membrane protein [Qingshengfaniella alkalisoli]QDY69626.1 TolC family outer membrane protein [Qingshengfaniella alkalisoli]